jgi:hypothetical protein
MERKIKKDFFKWIKYSDLNMFRIAYYLLFWDIISFNAKCLILCRFLDHNDIHVYVSPVIALNGNDRLYNRGIIGVKETMEAWKTREEAYVIVVMEGIDIYVKKRNYVC